MRPLVENEEEFKFLENEEEAILCFDKFIKRLKEKEKDPTTQGLAENPSHHEDESNCSEIEHR